jgi:hypothetical protein
VNCSDCIIGVFGSDCSQLCPRDSSGVVCGIHVYCDDGVSGGGHCSCDDGYATGPDGTCTECAPGFYGSNCTLCGRNTTISLPCSGRGICADGIQGSGTCLCTVGFGGAYCEANCGVANGLTCGGYGLCTGSGCQCFGNWSLQPDTLACTDCDSTHYGDGCRQQCGDCASGACNSGLLGEGECVCPKGYWGELCDGVCPGGITNPCSGHGSCGRATGLCTCYANKIQGYRIGEKCDQCDPRYVSASCSVACPVNDRGVVCSGRASCYNGTCSQCMARADDLFDIYCGTACDESDLLKCVSPCEPGFWGIDCNRFCPGFDGVNCSKTCSGRGVCGSDGLCYCTTPCGGPTCAFTCNTATVNGKVRTCSGNGVSVSEVLFRTMTNIRKESEVANVPTEDIQAASLNIKMDDSSWKMEECITSAHSPTLPLVTPQVAAPTQSNIHHYLQVQQPGTRAFVERDLSASVIHLSLRETPLPFPSGSGSQSPRGLLSSIHSMVEWFAVTTVIILFLLYPTLLQATTKMLQCEWTLGTLLVCTRC